MHSPEDGRPGLLSAARVAELFDCNPATVWRLADRGVLTRIRIGPRMVRYRTDEVAALMTPTNAERPAVTPGALAENAGATAHEPE
jgi:hypothetical protein